MNCTTLQITLPQKDPTKLVKGRGGRGMNPLCMAGREGMPSAYRHNWCNMGNIIIKILEHRNSL